jgi:hypothetical protein
MMSLITMADLECAKNPGHDSAKKRGSGQPPPKGALMMRAFCRCDPISLDWSRKKTDFPLALVCFKTMKTYLM